MQTTFIIILGIFILIMLIRGIYLENTDIEILYAFSIVIVIFITVGLVFSVNSDKKIVSKTLVTPKIEVQTTILDSTVIKSDTTFTYTFIK